MSFGVTSVSDPGFRAELTHVLDEEPALPAEVMASCGMKGCEE